MPKIRLIKIHGGTCFECENSKYYLETLSPWQEVTDEELAFLKSFDGRRILNRDGIVLIQEELTAQEVTEYINDIKDFVKKEKDRLAKLEKKQTEERKKKQELAEQRKIEKAKKLLEQNGIKLSD